MNNARVATTITETVELGVPVERVLTLLADRDFIRRRTAGNAVLPGRIGSHEVSPSRIVVEVLAEVPDGWLPERVRRAVSVRPGVRRVETWLLPSGRGEAAYDFTGVPAQATGTMQLEPVGAGSRLTQTVTLSVALPIVGRLVEQTVANQVSRGLRAEAQLYAVPDADASVADDAQESG